MVLTDRLLVIEDGQVVQDAAPAVVASRPATEYVARLVGLNLYRGTQASDSSIALNGGGRLFGTANSGQTLTSGSQLLVALRPSAISLHTEQPQQASPRNVWPGTVGGLELLTDRVRVQVDGRPSALVDITPAAVAELRLAPGSAVWLSAKATEVDCYPDQR